jgi:hypothetical protein
MAPVKRQAIAVTFFLVVTSATIYMTILLFSRIHGLGISKLFMLPLFIGFTLGMTIAIIFLRRAS